jgi:cytochrome c biogenesis protein CcdA
MFVISILGLALIDGINPSIIIMTVYLLSTTFPLKRTIAYIFGVFVTNLSLGLLAYFGLGSLMTVLINSLFELTDWWVYLLEFIAGIVLVYSAFKLNPDKDPEKAKEPKNISPKGTFFLGVFATFVEFATAAPYLGAIAILAKSSPSAFSSIITLSLYNLIYILIPITLVSIYQLKKQKAEPVFAKLNTIINKSFKKVLKILFIIIGVLFLADSIGYVLGRPIF